MVDECAPSCPPPSQIEIHAPKKRLHLKRPRKGVRCHSGQTPTFIDGVVAEAEVLPVVVAPQAYCVRRAFKERAFKGEGGPGSPRGFGIHGSARITGGIGEAEKLPLPAALINEQAPTIAKSIPLQGDFGGIGSLRAQGGRSAKGVRLSVRR